MSAELMKSKFVRRPSSTRPSVRLWHQLSLTLLHGFLSNFSCGFPCSICPGGFFFFFCFVFFFFIFENRMTSGFFTTIFLFRQHGSLWERKFQDATPPSPFSAISSQLFSQKCCFEFLKFWVFIFQIVFSFSLTSNAMGAKTSKRYSSLKTRLNPFKLFLTFVSGAHKHYSFEFLKFWVFNFSRFFVFVNMGPYGSQNFKTLLLPQINFESFLPFLNFLLIGPHKSTVFFCFVFQILSFWFLTNFERHQCTLWGNQKP